MPERLYIPAAYVDEVVPPGRASPDLWIGAPAGDAWWLAPCEDDEEPDIRLVPGEVVEFVWVERLGDLEVEIRDDGTHVALGPVPDGVTHFTFGLEVIGDSLDDFVRQWRDIGLECDADEPVVVDMARWATLGEHFLFEVGERGPRFVRPAPGAAGVPS